MSRTRGHRRPRGLADLWWAAAKLHMKSEKTPTVGEYEEALDHGLVGMGIDEWYDLDWYDYMKSDEYNWDF